MPESNVFVRGNALSGLSETQVGGESVLDTYERVIPRLRALAGDEAAALFARPAVMRGNGETQTSVSWYVPRAGAVRAWSALSADERIQVGAEIRSRLDRLRAAFDDPEIGDTVQSWLAIPSLEQDLVLVGGEPHLLNWGLVPESVADDAAARHAHFRRTLGLFGAEETSSPRIGSRAATAGAAAAAGVAGMAASGSAAAAPASAGGAAASASGPAVTPPPDGNGPVAVTEVRSRTWIPVAIAAGIAALVLLILLIPGVLRYDREAAAVAAAPALDEAARAQARESLRQRIAELQRALEENVCRPLDSPPGVPGLPALPGPDGGPAAPASPDGTPAAPPQPLVPPSPAALPPPVDTQVAGAPSTLLEFLDRGTALVVAPPVGGSGGEVSIGSAFFVNDRHLVTNRHVVEGADPSRVAIISNAMGRLVPARVVAASAQGDFGAADFAVLEVEAAPNRQVLTLATPVERLQNVIAVGYPGFVMQTDAAFQRLGQDGASIPDPVVTQGSVVALQTSASALPLVVHTATIAGGNSGGPLVDSCGRVVGVNTFGRFERETLLRLNFALGIEGLSGFLDANGVAYATAEDACAPAVVAQGPDESPGGAPDEPPGGAPDAPPGAPGETPPAEPVDAPVDAPRP